MIKKIVFLFCFFSMSMHIGAQVIYERTYPDEFPSIELPIELSDTSTFSMTAENNFCNSTFVRHIDANGNEVHTNPFHTEAFSYGYRWIGHDSVLIWYEQGSWDVGPDSFYISIWTPQTITQVHKESAHYDLPPLRKYGAFLYNAERIVFEKTNMLYLKNLVTSVIEDSIFIFTGIESILEFEDGILIFSKNGSPQVIDSYLNSIYHWHKIDDFPFDTAKAVTLDSFMIGKDENNLSLLQIVNVFDESIRQMDLSAHVSEIEDVQSNKDFLFVKGRSTDGLLVLQIDKEFQVLKVSALDTPEISGIKTLRYFPDRVYAWGNQGLGDYKANYRISYLYQDPQPIRLIDIKVDSMWINSLQIVTPTHPIYAHLEISCSISNLSSDTIHSATLHYDKNEPESTCFTGVQSIHFEELNVLPGATDTIQFQSYSTDLVYMHTLNRQYFLEHGNHQLDGDTSNNAYTLIYTLTTAEELQEDRIGIYPNPFTDVLTTSYSHTPVEMKLYTQIGHLVSRGKDQLENLGELPPGLYLLQIQSGHSLAVERVVKVE